MARDCELCGNPKAIGKYFTEPQEGCVSGWWRVCKDCTKMVEDQGYNVNFYKSYNNSIFKLTDNQKKCSHKWNKHSMVTLEGGYDWMEFKKCGCFGKRYGVGQFGVTDIQSTRPISNY